MCDQNNRCNKISSILFRLLLKLHVVDVHTSQWLIFVNDTINNIGLSGALNSQSPPASRACFRQSMKVKLRDTVYPSIDNRNQRIWKVLAV